MPPIVYPPPRPPIDGKINIGYVSSDLGNHPLSHLMQSVFGYHSSSEFNVFVYATSPSDKSPYRLKIERESQNFVDCSQESTQQIVDRIVKDEIHILVNLSGYTKGARNEVFAARPAPVQMSYMGFASTLSAGFCDYFIVGAPPFLLSSFLPKLNSLPIVQTRSSALLNSFLATSGATGEVTVSQSNAFAPRRLPTLKATSTRKGRASFSFTPRSVRIAVVLLLFSCACSPFSQPQSSTSLTRTSSPITNKLGARTRASASSSREKQRSLRRSLRRTM